MSSKVLVFAGSTRIDSLHRKLARAAAAELRRQGVEVTLADLRDYPMPLYDGDLEAAGVRRPGGGGPPRDPRDYPMPPFDGRLEGAGGLPEHARAFRELLRDHD